MDHKTLEPAPSLEGFLVYLMSSPWDYILFLAVAIGVTAYVAQIAANKL